MAATIAETLQDTLQADGTLTAIVATANIYITRTLGTSFINSTDTSDAYEAITGSGGVLRLLPVLVLTPSTGPDPVSACGMGRAEWYNVGAYDRDDYEDIEAMLERVHSVLHDNWYALTDGRAFHVEHVDTPVRGGSDDSIESGTGNVTCYEMARYLCTTEW